MVFAHECDAQSTGAFQADASRGPGRILFLALSKLAASSGHAELAFTGVILFGYSAAGVLTATMVNEQPDRILGAIEYIPGDVYVNIAQVPTTKQAGQVPTLILANAQDADGIAPEGGVKLVHDLLGSFPPIPVCRFLKRCNTDLGEGVFSREDLHF